MKEIKAFFYRLGVCYYFLFKKEYFDYDKFMKEDEEKCQMTKS